MFWRSSAALFAACLPLTGCSLLFGSEEAGNATDADPGDPNRPLYQFAFEENGQTMVVSTGQSDLTMRLQGSALIAGDALRLDQPDNLGLGSVVSTSVAIDAYNECTNSHEATIVAWISAGDIVDLGRQTRFPARIFSIENLGGNRTNFGLGQGIGPSAGEYDLLVVRTGSDSDSTLQVPVSEQEDPFFVAFSIFDEDSYRYQVGNIIGVGNASSGSRNWDWDDDMLLSLGAADNGLRPWRGAIHHLEFYCREVGVEEIAAIKERTSPN